MTATKTTAKAAKAPESDVVVVVTSDGQRAIETSTDADGVVSTVNRDATLEEQLAALAEEILDQVVRMTSQAGSGEAKVSGTTVTIKLESL